MILYLLYKQVSLMVIALHPSNPYTYCFTLQRSRDHPISRNFLLPDPVALFSPVTMANALLHAVNASTSSVMRPQSTNAAVRSEFRCATTDASSMHSRRLSRDKPVPAKCRALTYARIVSGRYSCRSFSSSSSPAVAVAASVYH